LLYTKIGNCNSLKTEIIDFILRTVFLSQWKLIRTQAHFENTITTNLNVLNDKANQICKKLLNALQMFQSCKKLLKKHSSPFYLEALTDIHEQLSSLIYPHFLEDIDEALLEHFPRYLKAVVRRLEKLPNDYLADRKHMLEIKKYWNKYKTLSSCSDLDDELNTLRWMIEEFRVSLFAQNLKTAIPISATRLNGYMQEKFSNI